MRSCEHRSGAQIVRLRFAAIGRPHSTRLGSQGNPLVWNSEFNIKPGAFQKCERFNLGIR